MPGVIGSISCEVYIQRVKKLFDVFDWINSRLKVLSKVDNSEKSGESRLVLFLRT